MVPSEPSLVIELVAETIKLTTNEKSDLNSGKLYKEPGTLFLRKESKTVIFSYPILFRRWWSQTGRFQWRNGNFNLPINKDQRVSSGTWWSFDLLDLFRSNKKDVKNLGLKRKRKISDYTSPKTVLRLLNKLRRNHKKHVNIRLINQCELSLLHNQIVGSQSNWLIGLTSLERDKYISWINRRI